MTAFTKYIQLQLCLLGSLTRLWTPWGQGSFSPLCFQVPASPSGLSVILRKCQGRIIDKLEEKEGRKRNSETGVTFQELQEQLQGCDMFNDRHPDHQEHLLRHCTSVALFPFPLFPQTCVFLLFLPFLLAHNLHFIELFSFYLPPHRSVTFIIYPQFGQRNKFREVFSLLVEAVDMAMAPVSPLRLVTLRYQQGLT